MRRLTRQKEQLISTVSALQRQPAKLPLGKQSQHGPQPDEDLETSCTVLLKHRLYDTEKATSSSSSLEARLREANSQCRKRAKAEEALKDQLTQQQTQSDRQLNAAKFTAAAAWKEFQASDLRELFEGVNITAAGGFCT